MVSSSDRISESRQQSNNPPLILVVDDDLGVRSLLRALMRDEGYQVIEASNGKQGLRLYEIFQPDLVLLDGYMPIMDGFTCCQQLRTSSASSVPIIMVTGSADPQTTDRALAIGVTECLTKPVHISLLRQRVRHHLQRSSVKQQQAV